MTKDTLRTVTEIEKARRGLSVFIILKDGQICGRLTARNIKKSNTTHVAFIIYPFINNGVEIAGYERVTGLGFNREVFGIHYVLEKLQAKLNEAFGIDFSDNNLLSENWTRDFQQAGFQVLQAL